MEACKTSLGQVRLEVNIYFAHYLMQHLKLVHEHVVLMDVIFVWFN